MEIEKGNKVAYAGTKNVSRKDAKIV